MKFTIVSVLLAAASALAFPFNVERRNSIQISDLWAKASATGAAMHFIVTDPNYPEDTPTDCNLIWSYGSSPKGNARCNNGQYYIRFPDGPVDLKSFTLELERVSGPIQEKGQAKLTSKSLWECVDNPQDAVQLDCKYLGVLSMNV